jgi:transcriptional regulator with XRE-family HTH domain
MGGSKFPYPACVVSIKIAAMDINSEKIQALRDAKPWSQDELAIAAGVSLRTIQRAEREGVASLQTIKAIASALQVDSNILRMPRNSEPTQIEVRQPQSKPTTMKYVFTGIGALAAVILVAFIAKHQGWLDARRNEEKPLAERILGHWESSSSGRVITFDLDGKQTNTGGSMPGNSVYTLLGDVISFGFRNQIVSMRVVFESSNEMAWTGVRTGYVAHYTRNKIVLPSRDIVYAAIVGKWRGSGDIKFLEIAGDRLKMELVDGRLIDTKLLLTDLQVTVRDAYAGAQYAITLDSPTEMTWSPVYTPDKYKLTRVNDSARAADTGAQAK